MSISLANSLRTNTKIKTVDLSNHKIGTQGAMALAEMLKQNKAITSLNLEGNNFGQEGLEAIATAVQRNDSISCLNIGYITEEYDYNKIATLMKSNTSIIDLRIIYTYHRVLSVRNALSYISYEELKVLESLPTRNKTYQQRLQPNVMQISVATTYVKANRENALKYSVFPLLSSILAFAEADPKQPLIKIDAFSRTRYFSAMLGVSFVAPTVQDILFRFEKLALASNQSSSHSSSYSSSSSSTRPKPLTPGYDRRPSKPVVEEHKEGESVQAKIKRYNNLAKSSQ